MQAMLLGSEPASKQAAHWQSSESNEWYTPPAYIEAARQAMGSIDLDPASCAYAQRTVQAAAYYDSETDGLAQAWEGNVWLNPPYGKVDGRSQVSVWAEKLGREYRTGAVVQAVFLCGTRHSEQAAVQKLMHLGHVCITRRRISFYMQDGAQTRPPGNNLFVYLGHRHVQFVAEFGSFGVVLQGAGRA